MSQRRAYKGHNYDDFFDDDDQPQRGRNNTNDFSRSRNGRNSGHYGNNWKDGKSNGRGPAPGAPTRSNTNNQTARNPVGEQDNDSSSGQPRTGTQPYRAVNDVREFGDHGNSHQQNQRPSNDNDEQHNNSQRSGRRDYYGDRFENDTRRDDGQSERGYEYRRDRGFGERSPRNPYEAGDFYSDNYQRNWDNRGQRNYDDRHYREPYPPNNYRYGDDRRYEGPPGYEPEEDDFRRSGRRNCSPPRRYNDRDSYHRGPPPGLFDYDDYNDSGRRPELRSRGYRNDARSGRNDFSDDERTPSRAQGRNDQRQSQSRTQRETEVRRTEQENKRSNTRNTRRSDTDESDNTTRTRARNVRPPTPDNDTTSSTSESEGEIIHVDPDTKKWPTTTLLILGETGVGKSTWINGIVNYLSYNSIEEAIEGDDVCLIPCKFSVTEGKPPRSIEVKIGDIDENEKLEAGKSATQKPQVYQFFNHKRGKIIRIIDTPGIGDVDGPIRDQENFKNIVDALGQEKELNGICILLKPNNARLTVVFRYCINELLTHLSKTAAPNISFCFTNSRATFYRPGDTMPMLQEYIDNLKKNGIDIQLNEYFCFDNEAFRYLACLKNGIKVGDTERDSYAGSWKQSVEETKKLLDYVRSIKPHSVEDTVSVNSARTIILTITRPLAEVNKFILDNITCIEEQEDRISKLDAKDVDLASKLKIQHIAYKNKDLGYPMTVCSGPKCTTTVKQPNSEVTQTIYTTHCHEHCYLTNIQPEKFPDPGLQHCEAMGGGGGENISCTKCGCGWEVHLHITYTQEKVTEEIEDETTQDLLQRRGCEKDAIRSAIDKLREDADEYQKEQKEIHKICAKFGRFLQMSSIIPYNDAIEDYLQMIIKEEENKKIKNEDFIAKLKLQIGEYRQQKTILDNSMKHGGGKVKEITASDVSRLRDELTALPLCGQMLSDAFAAAEHGIDTSQRQAVVDVHLHSNRWSKSTPLSSTTTNAKSTAKGKNKGKRP